MYDSTELLKQIQEQTEQFLQQAIGVWQVLPPEKLSQKPAPGKWSAAQCLEHLNIYGRHYLPAMEKAIAEAGKRGSRPGRHFNPGWLGNYFTRLMRPQADGSLKSKMSAPKNAVPAESPDPIKTLAEFIEQQEKMIQLLRAAETVNLNAIRIPISISPWIRLKLGDTLLFYTAHHERHVAQIGRIF